MRSLATSFSIEQSDEALDRRYFSVEKAIERIEHSDNPDVEKVKLFYEQAENIFKDMSIESEDQKINGLKWNGQSYDQKKMSDQELYKEVQGSLDRHDREEAVKNLMYFGSHYKRRYNQSKIYEPFFRSVMKLLDRVIRDLRLEQTYKEQKALDELRDQLKEVESDKQDQKQTIKDLQERNNVLRSSLQKAMFNADAIQLYTSMVKKKIRDKNFFTIMTYCMVMDGATAKEIHNNTKLDLKTIESTVKEYQSLFDITKTGKRYESVIRPDYNQQDMDDLYDEYEDKVKQVETGKRDVLSIVKNLFKKKEENDEK